MTDEEMAEEYVDDYGFGSDCNNLTSYDANQAIKQAFLAGLDVDRLDKRLMEAKSLIRNWINLVCNKLSEGCPGCEHCLFGDIKSKSDVFLKEVDNA